MMNKRFYESKKFWTAVVTAGTAIVLYATSNEGLAQLIAGVGATLIVGFGFQDFGKDASK